MEEVQYRSTKQRPDPFLEFVLAWLRRNPPRNVPREAVVTWDSGQFHQQDGKLIAMIDVELGHIGDPMMDLAARSEEHTSELQSLMRTSYAVFCLKKKNQQTNKTSNKLKNNLNKTILY